MTNNRKSTFLGTGIKRCLLITMLCLCPAVWTQNRGTAVQADGIDFVFCLDQSGSMSGAVEHPSANDPHNRRNWLLYSLVRYRLIPETASGKIFRISVVEFGSRHGSEPRYQVSQTLSNYTLEGPKAGESIPDYEQRVAGELRFLEVERKRGYSDHGKALELVGDALRSFENNPIGVSYGGHGVRDRAKIVVMVTDGLPVVRNQNGAVMAQGVLKDEIRRWIHDFPGETALLVFGLNDADNYWIDLGYGRFWDDLAALTSARGQPGAGQMIRDHSNMLFEVIEKINRFMPPPLQPILNDSVDVPPYLRALRFVVEFRKPYIKLPEHLEIIQPDGAKIDLSQALVQPVQAEVIIRNPQGGVWRLPQKKATVANRMKIIHFQENQPAKLVNPPSPVYLNQNLPIHFQVEGHGRNGFFEPFVQYPVEGIIKVRYQDPVQGVVSPEIPLRAEWDKGDQGLFISTTPFLFDKAGDYLVSFEGLVMTASGDKKVVFHSYDNPVIVSDKKQISARLEKPKGKIGTFFGNLKQDFEFGFYSDDVFFPAEDVLEKGDPIIFEFRISDKKDRILHSELVELEQREGRLAGRVQHSLGWRQSLNLLFGRFRGQLKLMVDNRNFKDDYVYGTSGAAFELYRPERKIGLDWLSLILLLGPLLVLAGGLLWLAYLFLIHRLIKLSPFTPVIHYRVDDPFDNNPHVNWKKTVPMKYADKQGAVRLDLPDSTETWKPRLTVKRLFQANGVRVKLTYGAYGRKKSDKDYLVNQILTTRKNDTEPGKQPVVGLEDKNLIFELHIKA